MTYDNYPVPSPESLFWRTNTGLFSPRFILEVVRHSEESGPFVNSNLFLPIIQTIFGTLLGGGLVMLADCFRRRDEHRRGVQQGYERTYVTEGVDPLITYFISLDIRLRSLNLEQDITPLSSPEPVPAAALAHVHVLLADRALTDIALLLHEYFHHPCIEAPVVSKGTSAIGRVNSTLLELHQALLRAISEMRSQEVNLGNRAYFVAQFKAIHTDLNAVVVTGIIKGTGQREQQERAS